MHHAEVVLVTYRPSINPPFGDSGESQEFPQKFMRRNASRAPPLTSKLFELIRANRTRESNRTDIKSSSRFRLFSDGPGLSGQVGFPALAARLPMHEH